MFVHIHNPNQPALRRAFTLVELLMVIMLIGIMTSFVLVALAGAARTAQEDRTKAQILKIHELIMENWEQYRYRRVPQTRLMREITNRPATGRQTQVMALERLNALRELMRMEMPSFMLDVTTPASKLRDMLTNQPYQPSVWRAYNRRAAAASWTVQYQDAECLYLDSVPDSGCRFIRVGVLQGIRDYGSGWRRHERDRRRVGQSDSMDAVGAKLHLTVAGTDVCR